MNEKECKVCGRPLVKRNTKRSATQLTKPYYYTAYYFCPHCNRLYHDEEFKVVNKNVNAFISDNLNTKDFDIEIWTDGACVHNGTPKAKAAWAFVAGEYEEAGRVEGKQTNNRAEAQALYHALKWAGEKSYKRVKLHTDSQITLHGVAKSPKLVKVNGDIFQKIHSIVTKHSLDVRYEKVLGHSGIEGNVRADKLANALATSTS